MSTLRLPVRWLSVLLAGGWLLARAELPPLLPRQVLFSPPGRIRPLISTDGQYVAWMGPTNGIMNLWVQRVGTNDARMVSRDLRGTVHQPVWQSDGQAVLFLQDSDGFGNWHLMQAHVRSGIIRDLTPFVGVQARLVATSARVVDEILVAMNLRDRRLLDVFRIDVRTGALTLDTENTGEVVGWFADDALDIRLAQVVLPNGEMALSTRSDPRSLWRPLLRWGPDDALGKVVGFGPGQSNVWLVSSVQAPAPRLLSIHLATGATTVVAKDPRFDVLSALTHPYSNTLEAVQFQRDRVQWQILQPGLAHDLAALSAFRDGDLDILSRDAADRLWTVAYTLDNAPVQYALYDRPARKVTPLFTEHPALAGARLASTRPVSLKARDGRPLEGYLTLPEGVEPRGLPAVLLVHGGPWSRNTWGFDPEVQWLANRGYAVLQVNFRGSTGYGKDHLNAGDKEWGGKILLDLVDTRKWAVDAGYVDPKRVAIMGTGFGGYATLACLAFQPDAFVAGVSLAGPPDLLTMVSAVPKEAAGIRAVFDRRVGDPDKDVDLLRAQSPGTRANLIQAPLLTAIAGGDPQIPVADMDRFVAALRRAGRAVDYLFFGDETGVLRSPANRFRFLAAAEAFLGRHLGGRVEPPSDAERFDQLTR